MLKEEVEEFYDIFSKNYPKLHSSRFVDKIFEYFISRYLPPKEKLIILDAGGGIGRFSFPLAKRAYKIILTDISIGMLNKAKEIADNLGFKNIKFFKESVTNMKNQKNDEFDVVLLMNSILDYCSDHKKALREVFRVLRKYGVVLGTVNNRLIYTTTNILLEKKDVKEFEKAFETGNYPKRFLIHDFTLEELRKELTEAGFKIINILGPTNLLRKWEYEDIVNKENEKDILNSQIKFTQKKEYLNNSSDFFFIAKKS